MSLTSKGINELFDQFRDDVLLNTVIFFLFSLIVFYLVLKLTILNRINKIARIIDKSRNSEELQLCPEEGSDELGILVSAYNAALSSDFEHKKELQRTNQELVNTSNIDALTGISNRRKFDRVLQDEWSRSIREKTPITLLMIDIDHFKQLNDQHGHSAGDICLRRVAQELNTLLKRPGDLLSRYGGEEFCIILPNTLDRQCIVAETCRKAIEKLKISVNPGDNPLSVTVSIGSAVYYPVYDEAATNLLKQADGALYEAKHRGRNQVVHFSGEGTTDIAAQFESVRPKP